MLVAQSGQGHSLLNVSSVSAGQRATQPFHQKRLTSSDGYLILTTVGQGFATLVDLSISL